MYTTKQYHPKKPPQPKNGVNTIDEYGIKRKVDSRHKDPGFKMQPPKRGQTDGYFEKRETYFKYVEDEYKGAPKLNEGRKKPSDFGFGSRDVPKTDEFTNQTRQNQWKELLRTETQFQESWANQRAATRGLNDSLDEMIQDPQNRSIRFAQENDARRARGLPAHFQTQVPTQLYDVGKAGSGETPVCNKCHSDTFYCKHRVGYGIVNTRRDGGSEYRTSSQEVGSRVWGISTKPSHGRVRTTKTFFDISNVGH
jgi:hypothetical protein